MEGLGGTRTAGLERCFTPSKPAVLALCIHDSRCRVVCLSGTRLSKRYLVRASRPGAYEGTPPASLRDGRPARTWGACVLVPRPCSGKDCDRGNHASNSRLSCPHAFEVRRR
jgi:hypothetical protein